MREDLKNVFRKHCMIWEVGTVHDNKADLIFTLNFEGQ